MKKIAIVGTGGLGREVLGILETLNKKKRKWEILGFYDDNCTNNLVNGYPVLGSLDLLNKVEEELAVVVGIGNPLIREKITDKISNVYITYPNIIHPSVQIYSQNTVFLGKGIVLGANVVLTTNISIGDFTYVNTSTTLAHDISIGKFCVIMPSVCLSAGGEIHDKVYVGNSVKADCPVLFKEEERIKIGTIITK